MKSNEQVSKNRIRTSQMKIKLIYISCVLLTFVGIKNSFAQSNINKQLIAQKRDTIPQPIGYVSDFEKIFSANEVETLTTLIKDFEVKAGIQIAILTADSSMVESERFESYVVAVGNKWGVGDQYGKKGIVIGFSRGQRQISISNGHGIERLISDKETKEVIQGHLIPYFKKNEYYQGTLEALKSLIELLNTKLVK